MNILLVVIGIVFVLLLLSLLATTIMELIASAFSLRGKNLEAALRNLLASSDIDEKLLATFKENALYRQLSARFGSKRVSPSYLSPESFQSILFDVILKGEGLEKLESKIEELPDMDLKNVLKQLLRDADNRLDNFKLKINTWYNDVMDRATGWYKRSTQKILIGVGLAIAVIFNADSISIFARLWQDPALTAQIADMAETFVEQNPGDTLRPVDPDFNQSYQELQNLMDNHITAVKAPLGLGWYTADFVDYNAYDWLIKVLGWIVTALAISLGAPFWFDLLKRLVSIRSSGKKPGE